MQVYFLGQTQTTQKTWWSRVYGLISVIRQFGTFSGISSGTFLGTPLTYDLHAAIDITYCDLPSKNRLWKIYLSGNFPE